MESPTAPTIETQFSKVGLEVISSTFEPGGHETVLYFVPPPKVGERVCQDCEKPALFVLYDKSHDGDKSVNSFCRDHSTENFFNILNARKSG